MPMANIFQPAQDTPHFVLAIVLSTLVFVGIMWGIQRLAPQPRKWLTIVLTFVAGLFYLLEYMLPLHAVVAPDGSTAQQNFLTPFLRPVSDFNNDTFIWTVGLGIISLAIVHGRRLFSRRPGWHNDLAFFLALISITVVGFASHAGQTGSTLAKFSYNALFNGLLINLDSAMFALLAFYIASAAYRAFRIRSLEAALLMVSALVVMLGVIKFGVLLTTWIPLDSPWAYFRIERLSLWVLNWINMPTQRAVAIGVAVGSVAMAMRLWLSLERGSFFTQEG